MELLIGQYLEIKQEVNVEAQYKVLVNALLAASPKDFANAEIVARLDKGFSTIRYNCEDKGKRIEGLVADEVDDFAVDEALHAIRNAMTIPSQKPWSKCKFTLFPDGKFKFDVEYDD
jgi:hypothetical protein